MDFSKKKSQISKISLLLIIFISLIFSESIFALDSPELIEEIIEVPIIIEEPFIEEPLEVPFDINETNTTNQTINESNLTIVLNETLNDTIEIPLDINETKTDTNTTLNDTIEESQEIPEEIIIEESIEKVDEEKIEKPKKPTPPEQLPLSQPLDKSFSVTRKTFIHANGNLIATKQKDMLDETIYYIQDHLGSNVKVINGNVEAQENKYYAFGETEEIIEGDNDYQYTGKELDDETGLYYYGARYYDPNIGRFMAADFVKGDISGPLSLNRYAYVLNNPLKYIDPSGNQAQKPITNKADSTITAKFHRGVSVYPKQISDTLQTVGVGVRDFSKDYPLENSLGFNMFWDDRVDSIFVDSAATSQISSDQFFSLLVGNEGGNAANSLGGVSQKELEGKWETVKKEAAGGNKIADRLVKHIIKTYGADTPANRARLGDEAVSTINDIILQRGTKSLPQSLNDLSNLDDKTKKDPKIIQDAKDDFKK